MIAQTNATISAKSTIASTARMQKSRATKVRRQTRWVSVPADTRGQRYALMTVDDDDDDLLTRVCVLTGGVR
jgi:hypothetical protein